jgi:hypothetical protein
MPCNHTRSLWHYDGMSRKSVQGHDFSVIARKVVERAIGEKLDGSPLDDPLEGKSPKAVARGRLGGLKGGRARAEKLSAKRRKQISYRANNARWKKRKRKS